MGVIFLGDALCLGRYIILFPSHEIAEAYAYKDLHTQYYLCYLQCTNLFFKNSPCFCSCSIIGAIIISVGFYAVVWAKAKEELSEDHCNGILGSSSDGKTPLLHSYKAAGI